jgi:hypothetical protein
MKKLFSMILVLGLLFGGSAYSSIIEVNKLAELSKEETE